jgi:hypothetical protein
VPTNAVLLVDEVLLAIMKVLATAFTLLGLTNQRLRFRDVAVQLTELLGALHATPDT